LGSATRFTGDGSGINHGAGRQQGESRNKHPEHFMMAAHSCFHVTQPIVFIGYHVNESSRCSCKYYPIT
jgi:hypothetical protein